jgi:Xaa-Pro aminopeptidase
LRSARQRTSFPGGSSISGPGSSRLSAIRKSFEKKGVQGFFITTVVNVRYLSGFTGSSGFLLIAKDRNIFVTDFRYEEQAHRELGERGDEWEISIERGDRLKTIKRLLADIGIRTLGFESSLPYEFFEGLSRCGARLKPLRETVEMQRAAKDPGEIRFVREAVRRAEGAFLDVRRHIRRGRREREIASMLEERLRKRGCNRMPFDIIVASGPNSAMPHARATERKLSPGDLVVIDWGGEAEGYYADMTRTFLVEGTVPPRGGETTKKKEIYRRVLEANKKAISVVRPGIESRVIDRAARDSIKDAGYEKFFGHGTGHGVGLDVHELPRISWKRSAPVKENMIFTVEPGIYIEGLGGVRIEDMVLVKPEGAEVLTKLPRSLEVI